MNPPGIVVWHKKKPNFGWGAKGSFPKDFEPVAHVDTEDFQKAFELTNNIGMDWWGFNKEVWILKPRPKNLSPTIRGYIRSTSVGDVMELHGHLIYVAPVGFESWGEVRTKEDYERNPRMKLMTKEIMKQIPRLYSQEKVKDPIVYVKFFTPDSGWTWYATEYDPEQRLFFGLVVSPMEPEGELGYFSLDELASARGPLGLPIERDSWFMPVPLSKVRKSTNPRLMQRPSELRGGMSEGYVSTAFDKRELQMGIKVEMEHTRNKRIAKMIAMDHLSEIPDYYTRLAIMEEQAKISKNTPRRRRRNLRMRY